MENSREKLFQDFGEFRARLIAIKFLNNITPDPTGTLYLTDAIAKAQYYAPEKALLFVSLLLEEIDFLISEHSEFCKKVIENNFANIKQNPFNETKEIYQARVKDVSNAFSSRVKSELDSYKTKLGKLADLLRNDIESFGEGSTTDKLQFNITIRQIACMVRLFKELNIVPHDVTNVSLAGKISAHLSGKKGGGKGIESLEKLLSSPDEKTLDFWTEQFKELALKAKAMQEKLI